MSNIHQLRPESSDTTHQVADESKGRPVAYVTFTLIGYDNTKLIFSVMLEPKPGVVEQREVTVGFEDGMHILQRVLPMLDFRLPVALHYNPVVGATKPDGSAYALHELPLQGQPTGLYIGHNPGTFVPLPNTQL